MKIHPFVQPVAQPSIVHARLDVPGSHMIITIETFSWQECGRLVKDENKGNRHMANTPVQRIEHDIKTGRYYVTHQGVAFWPDGSILDGQHRFEGAARTQTDFTTMVTRYTDETAARNAAEVTDSGKARQVADSLVFSGIMKREIAVLATQTTVFLHSLMHGIDTAMTRQEVGDFYQAWQEPIDWACTTLTEKRFTSTLRACFVFGWLVNKAKTIEFADLLKSGAAEPGSAAALWNQMQGDGSFSVVGGHGARRQAAFRALRVIQLCLTVASVPGHVQAQESALAWFRARLPKAQPANDSAPMENALDPRILALMANGGEWEPKNICAALGSAQSGTQTRIAAMESAGKIVRIRRGVYALPATKAA